MNKIPFKRLRLGSIFAGRYEVVSLLGEGGMGAVYRVRDRALAEDVALKILVPPVTGAAEFASMFRQEVKLSRKVTHANVIHVYDIGEQDGVLFMTMELVEGHTLRTMMNATAEQRLGLSAIRIGYELANGLAAVHAHGIVHRDLKPGNVMICKTGRVVLADFGIASHLDVNDPANQGMFMGTISYMAPEQFSKKPCSIQTDIYSFGLVLLEAMTGHLATYGISMADRLARPVDVNLGSVVGDAKIIREVERILRLCLANDPDKRPRSIEEVSHTLRSLLPEGSTGPGFSSTGSHVMSTGVSVPGASSGPVGTDMTNEILTEISAQGISDEMAREFLAARHDSRMNDADRLIIAFERLDNIVQHSPHFPRAIALRAVTAVRCWYLDRKSSGLDWEQVATESINFAMERAPEMSDTHLAAAMLATQRFEMKGSSRALIRALQIEPRSFAAQEYLGMLQVETGLVDEGIARLVYAATEIPPRPLACAVHAGCCALLGKYDEAVVHLAEANRRYNVPNRGTALHRLRLHAWRDGKRPVMLSISERTAMQRHGWKNVQCYLDVLAGTADENTIVKWLETVEVDSSNPRFHMVNWQLGAEMLAILGLKTKTLEMLAKCARKGLIDLNWIDRCPLFHPFRGTDEFRAIRNWVYLNAEGVWS